MKKTFALFLIAFSLTLLSLLSCQKTETTTADTESGKTRFPIAEARAWYETSLGSNVALSRTNGNAKIKNFTPLWEQGVTGEDETYYIVESPLKFDKTPGFLVQSPSANADTSNVKGKTKLLVLKNKQTGRILSALMHIVSENSSGNEIKYRPKNSHLTGYIFFTDLEGEYVNGWKYKNGELIAKGSNAAQQVNAKALPPDDEHNNSCWSVVTNWYERDCVEYYNGSYQCGSWNYMYSTTQTYCPSNGGGSGGGGYSGGNVGTLEALLADFDNRIKDSLQHQCLKDVLDSIKKIKNGKIAEIIQQFSGEIPSWNLTFKEGYAGGNNAQTDPFFTEGFINITLDYNRIGNGTDLAIARTMMHEAVHAYLVAYFKNDPNSFQKDYKQLFDDYIAQKSTGVAQHEEMGRSFVNQIATALTQFGERRGYNISDQVYHDIAWGGLYGDNSGVPAFNSLSPSERERIRYRNAAENSNTTRDGEVPAGIKKCN